MSAHGFIPCTMARQIGDTGVFFRPVKSWHSGTYAGERLYELPDSGDRSGCLRPDGRADPPYTVTHRMYWHERAPEHKVSAFLSYPNGMGAMDDYFWECNGVDPNGDVTRFTGDDAESEMETAIINFLVYGNHYVYPER